MQDSLFDLQCKTILEIGFGAGKNTILLAAIDEEVLDLDISSRMIRKGKEKPEPGNVTFSLQTFARGGFVRVGALNLPFANLSSST